MSKNVYVDLDTVKYVDWTTIKHSPGVEPVHYVRVVLKNGLTIFIDAPIANDISFKSNEMWEDMEKLL